MDTKGTRKTSVNTNDIKKGLRFFRGAFKKVEHLVGNVQNQVHQKIEKAKSFSNPRSQKTGASQANKALSVQHIDVAKPVAAPKISNYHTTPVSNVAPQNVVSVAHVEVVSPNTSPYAVSPQRHQVNDYAKSQVNNGTATTTIQAQLPNHAHLTPISLDGKIENFDELGKGSFGIVYKTTLVSNDPALRNFCINGKNELCLKVLQDKSQIEELMHEAHIGHLLNEHYKTKKAQNHGVFVPSYNVSTLAKINLTYVIVGRYAKHGSLDTYITNNHKQVSPTIISGWMEQALNGLNNMHEANIVHGDVACRNLLLGEQGIELTDFGKSGVLAGNDTSLPDRNDRIPIRWSDKSRLNGKGISKFSDIFAMKVTMIEMIARYALQKDILQLTCGMTNTEVGMMITQGGNDLYLEHLIGKLRSGLRMTNQTELLSMVDAFKECLTLTKEQADGNYSMKQFMADYRTGVDRLKTLANDNVTTHRMRMA